MCYILLGLFFFFQAEDGIRDLVRSRGLGDVYKRQVVLAAPRGLITTDQRQAGFTDGFTAGGGRIERVHLSLIHI